MWHSGTLFRGPFDTPGLMIGLDHLKDLFQPKWCYYSMQIEIKHDCYVFPSKQTS